MWDETVNADIKTDIASIYSERFDLSPDFDATHDDKYQVDKPTDDFCMKLSQCTDIMGSTINGDIEQNDSNLSSVYGQYQIDSRNRILGRCLSTEESLCTECRFGNRLNNLFASMNTTREQVQSSCFPSVLGNQCDRRILLRKRSLPVTPKRRNSELHMRQFFLSRNNLKKFKSEGSISTTKNTGSNNSALIQPIIVTHEISVKNSTNIEQIVEPSATACGGTILPGLNRSNNFSKHTAEIEKTSSKISNYSRASSYLFLPRQVQSKLFDQIERVKISPTKSTVQDVVEEMLIDESTTGNKTNQRSFNEMILCQSQNSNTNDSNCIKTEISQSTIEEIYHIDITDEIKDLKTVDLMEELQVTDNLEYNISPFNPSTIEEVNHIDPVTDIGCLAAVEAIDELPGYVRAEENSAQGIINEEIIRREKIMGTTVIDFGLQPLITSRPNEMNTGKHNPLIFSCTKDLNSEIYAGFNERAEDGLQFQCMSETQLKSTGREIKIAAKNIGSVHPIDDPVTTVHSAKDPQFSNGEFPEVPEDSILEITVVSESDSILRQDAIIERGGINSVYFLDNLKTKSTNSKTAIEGKRDTRNGPADLIVDTNGNHRVNVNSSKEDDLATSSLIVRQLANVENQVGMGTKGMSSVNSTGNSATNITSIKCLSIPNKIVQALRDDLSLESLSETELQRIEKDAYMKANEAESATNSSNQNIKSVANEQDVFYRPERLNMINEDSNDGLVIPNWVMSPFSAPNYGKMKSAIQMRRWYTKKMLQEILRLSTKVSKIGSIAHAGVQYNDSRVVLKSSSQIQDSHQIHCTEMNDKNRSVDLETSGSSCRNFVPEYNSIFYVPNSNQSKYNVSSDKVTAAASTARTTTNDFRKDLEGNNKFYAPRSNRSKYDAAIIFNQPNEIAFNGGNFSSSRMQSNASNIFVSLEHDFNGNRTCEPDISSAWQSKGSETEIQMRKSNSNAFSKNKENLEKRIKAKYQSPKTSSNATVPVKDEMGSRVNKFEPVDNDTIFYLPDKLSSGSNNYTMKNIQTLFPANYTKRLSTRMKVDGPRPPDFGKSSAPLAINDDSIFYISNKKKETTFNIL